MLFTQTQLFDSQDKLYTKERDRKETEIGKHFTFLFLTTYFVMHAAFCNKFHLGQLSISQSLIKQKTKLAIFASMLIEMLQLYIVFASPLVMFWIRKMDYGSIY